VAQEVQIQLWALKSPSTLRVQIQLSAPNWSTLRVQIQLSGANPSPPLRVQIQLFGETPPSVLTTGARSCAAALRGGGGREGGGEHRDAQRGRDEQRAQAARSGRGADHR
jgi:hypothetical protein